MCWGRLSQSVLWSSDRSVLAHRLAACGLQIGKSSVKSCATKSLHLPTTPESIVCSKSYYGSCSKTYQLIIIYNLRCIKDRKGPRALSAGAIPRPDEEQSNAYNYKGSSPKLFEDQSHEALLLFHQLFGVGATCWSNCRQPCPLPLPLQKRPFKSEKTTSQVVISDLGGT